MSSPPKAEVVASEPGLYELTLERLRRLPRGERMVYSHDEFRRSKRWDAARTAMEEGHVTLVAERVDGELRRVAIGLRR